LDRFTEIQEAFLQLACALICLRFLRPMTSFLPNALSVVSLAILPNREGGEREERKYDRRYKAGRQSIDSHEKFKASM
jgi:hypothetical protein